MAGYYKKMVEALKGIDKKSTFEIANSIWVSKYLNIRKEFVSVVKDNFASENRTVDFMDPTVVNQINKWCSDNTHGKIKEIVKSISPETVMVLVNALYFNGKWGGFKFNDKTNKEDFRKMADVSLGTIYIGTVKHKTFIDVNTKGTEAAAVTYVGMKFEAAAPPMYDTVGFIVDRPFFYIISESSTGSILFLGQKTR